MSDNEHLRRFATDSQWEKLQAIEEGGSERAAARILGCNQSTINRAKKAVLAKAARQGYAPEYDMQREVPDGYRVRGVSTLYNAEGDLKLQWVKSQIDRDRQWEMFHEAVKGFTTDLPRYKPVKAPKTLYSDLMTVYPVGDHHVGMLAWDKETGADYDLKIAERLLTGAIDHLVDASKACEEAAVIFLGDFLHYDSFVPVTPTSRNQLDTDSRYPKMVRTAIRMMRYTVDRALTKHKRVRVIVEIGNHDLSSSIFLMECLHTVYEHEPRVIVDTSPMHFHYFRFGQCLVGTHHGHGTKMSNLPMIMAADRAKDWGETTYRYWYTGHIHQSKTQAATSALDFSGCMVESFRILASPDAWAHQKGYRSMSEMNSITLHKEFGEVSRNRVRPAMLKSS